MRDVATSLEEMVRVLKPGGWLITTGDPYRSRHLGDDHELAVFDRHPDVLLGVNELIPSFTVFESVLAKYRDRLDITIVTGELHPSHCSWSGDRPSRVTARAIKRLATRILHPSIPRRKSDAGYAGGLQRWDFDRDREALGNCSGTIALCCHTRREIPISPNCQGETVIPAGDYAQSLTDYQQAIQELAPLVPAHQVNCPFPGEHQTKFELLNGWQAPSGGQARGAYRRARWYLRRPTQAVTLSFAVRRPDVPATGSVAVNLFVNGVKVLAVQLISDDWHEVVLPVRQLPADETFVCELQLNSTAGSFDDGVFRVRDRKFE